MQEMGPLGFYPFVSVAIYWRLSYCPHKYEPFKGKCDLNLDIQIIIDESGSVGRDNFDILKTVSRGLEDHQTRKIILLCYVMCCSAAKI